MMRIQFVVARGCFAIVVLTAGVATAVAQSSKLPNPADPNAAAPAATHESAFSDYQPFREQEIRSWKEVNQEVADNPGMGSTVDLSGKSMGSTLAVGNHAGGHSHEDEAIGKPGVAANVIRTVSVDMTDTMGFNPADLTVRQGETIRFVVKNSGKLKHEFVLGTAQGLKAHYEVMKKNPEMEHAEANMVTVAPGKTGEVIWQFTKPGKVDFACLQPGHYDAGMKGQITVGKVATSIAQAQSTTVQGQTGGDTAQPSARSAEMTEGEVRKVDKESRKITLKHGEIKNLDMPGMTMVFRVKDEAMLDNVAAGDKIRFTADKIDGAITVMSIEKQ